MVRFVSRKIRHVADDLRFRALVTRLLARAEYPDPLSLGSVREELSAKVAEFGAVVLERAADVLVRP